MSCPPSLSVSEWTIPYIFGYRGHSRAQKISPNMPQLTRFAFVHTQTVILASILPGNDCIMSTFLVGIRVDHTTYLWPQGPPSGPKNEPKYIQTNHICLSPRSNSIARGHPSLKSPRECLYHVHLPCWCLGGPYYTFAQSNQICLCPCSNSIAKGHPSLKSPRECLYHVWYGPPGHQQGRWT